MTLVGPEAATCREYVVPRLKSAGWDAEPHTISEQDTFTDGRVQVVGTTTLRQPKKRTDYLTGLERSLDAFPSPDELWARYREAKGLDEEEAAKLLTPFYLIAGKKPRYYQDIAINRVVEAVVQGVPRILLTMATGTGKTTTAFQICWKLRESRWNRTGQHRKPRILYLADRNILVDDPKDKDFAAFGDARHKITAGHTITSREMYFSTYQQLVHQEGQPALYQAYAPDFFDLIVVDECHRGSADAESLWRDILEYFAPAVQLGLTATPKREETANTYAYFGDPVYEYSLRQGIDDGYLAPYRVHRVLTTYDAFGYRPAPGDRDRHGRLIPDAEYTTPDFERRVVIRARTQAIARHLTAFLKASNRFDKTMVFCVDQEHALEMKAALNNLNADLVKPYPDYVCRVTSDEGEVGLTHLDNFRNVEKKSPVILTTSQLLTTGVDAPTCKNVVLVRDIGSMVEFKQIIGRGTRVRADHGKFYFNIIDYTNRATRLFADPDFDGDPLDITDVDETGSAEPPNAPQQVAEATGGADYVIRDDHDLTAGPRKYYVDFDGGNVEIEAQFVYELAPDGTRLRCVEYTEYAADAVRSLAPDGAALREQWISVWSRDEVIKALAQRGIDFEHLAGVMGQPDADPFDLLCHIAFSAPVRTRRERADRLRREQHAFFEQYGPEARAILHELLDNYAAHGIGQLAMPQALGVPPISAHGNLREIGQLFGGVPQLGQAIDRLQTLLYAA